MKSYLLSIFFSLLLPSFIIAQITITGEIRPRAEYRHGFKTLAEDNQDAAFFIDQRSRLNFDLKSEKVQYFLSLQDVRVWGNQPQLVVNQGASTGLHQAWAKFGLNENWALKLGRQEIAYDDQRIFGNVGWAQQARSHDAGLLIFQDSSFTGHLGLAYNQDKAQLNTTRYTISNNYKTIQYLWLHKTWNALSGSLLFLNNGVQVNFSDGSFDTKFSQTIGGRLSYKKSDWQINVASYFQGGQHSDTLGTKNQAYYIGIDVLYGLKDDFSLMGGVEMLSGNSQFDNGKDNNAFTPFYGTNHKFNGLMDYFYVGNHVGNVGLNDIFIKAIYKKNRISMSLTAHYFLANNDIIDIQQSGSMAAFLGTEFDYTVGFKFDKTTKLNLGYSQLFGTSSLEALKGGDHNSTNNWFWVMMTFKPAYTFKNNN